MSQALQRQTEGGMGWPVPEEWLEEIVRLALKEDLGPGDITTVATVPSSVLGRATIVAREEGVICGLNVAREVFKAVDQHLEWRPCSIDGDTISQGEMVAVIAGTLRSLLTAERTALNFMQRMSGIATATRLFVNAVDGTGATILDTRKTAPGLRILDKYAVRCGGGRNHRGGLFDGVLIKDNHIAGAGGGIRSVVEAAKSWAPHTLSVEVEVDRIDQIEDALSGGCNAILLDNMSGPEVKEAVKLIAGRAATEASGRVTLETVRSIAETGVDFISVGALTHSVKALDLSMEIEKI